LKGLLSTLSCPERRRAVSSKLLIKEESSWPAVCA
jgi:hypothetical protein